LIVEVKIHCFWLISSKLTLPTNPTFAVVGHICAINSFWWQPCSIGGPE